MPKDNSVRIGVSHIYINFDDDGLTTITHQSAGGTTTMQTGFAPEPAQALALVRMLMPLTREKDAS